MNNTERGFEILHHSYRSKWASGEKFAEKLGITKEEDEIPDWQYYIHNLIFRATGAYQRIQILDK